MAAQLPFWHVVPDGHWESLRHWTQVAVLESQNGVGGWQVPQMVTQALPEHTNPTGQSVFDRHWTQ